MGIILKKKILKIQQILPQVQMKLQVVILEFTIRRVNKPTPETYSQLMEHLKAQLNTLVLTLMDKVFNNPRATYLMLRKNPKRKKKSVFHQWDLDLLNTNQKQETDM